MCCRSFAFLSFASSVPSLFFLAQSHFAAQKNCCRIPALQSPTDGLFGSPHCMMSAPCPTRGYHGWLRYLTAPNSTAEAFEYIHARSVFFISKAVNRGQKIIRLLASCCACIRIAWYLSCCYCIPPCALLSFGAYGALFASSAAVECFHKSRFRLP